MLNSKRIEKLTNIKDINYKLAAFHVLGTTICFGAATLVYNKIENPDKVNTKIEIVNVDNNNVTPEFDIQFEPKVKTAVNKPIAWTIIAWCVLNGFSFGGKAYTDIKNAKRASKLLQENKRASFLRQKTR